MTAAANPLTEFTWHRQPEAERLVRELVDDFLRKCPEASAAAERMKANSSASPNDQVRSPVDVTAAMEARWKGTLLFISRPQNHERRDE